MPRVQTDEHLAIIAWADPAERTVPPSSRIGNRTNCSDVAAFLERCTLTDAIAVQFLRGAAIAPES